MTEPLYHLLEQDGTLVMSDYVIPAGAVAVLVEGFIRAGRTVEAHPVTRCEDAMCGRDGP